MSCRGKVWSCCRLNRTSECSSFADREPIGAYAVPLLNQQALLLEHNSNLSRVVSSDLLENGNQDAECVVTDHRTSRDLSDVTSFRGGNRQTLAAVHMQHDVNVGATVANVD